MLRYSKRGLLVALCLCLVLGGTEAWAAKKKRKAKKQRRQDVTRVEPGAATPSPADAANGAASGTEAETTPGTEQGAPAAELEGPPLPPDATADRHAAPTAETKPAELAGANAVQATVPAPQPGPGLALSASAVLGLLVPTEGPYPVPAAKLRADVRAVRYVLNERLTLTGGGALGLSLGGRSDNVSGIGISQLVFTFELVPTAMVEVALFDKVSAYAALGLGLLVIQNEAKAGFGTMTFGLGNTNAAGVLHVAAGGAYQLNDKLRVLGEVVGFDVIFWEHGSGALYTLLFGAAYAL
jgi:hypothetical protein